MEICNSGKLFVVHPEFLRSSNTCKFQRNSLSPVSVGRFVDLVLCFPVTLHMLSDIDNDIST